MATDKQILRNLGELLVARNIDCPGCKNIRLQHVKPKLAMASNVPSLWRRYLVVINTNCLEMLPG